MMREIVLDTETTGIEPAEGHRIVEIGAIELVNHLPSGKFFHAYLDPQMDVPKEAEAVHGLSTAFLKGKPLFGAVADDFLSFVGETKLIIHNARFDLKFINAELSAIGKPAISMGQVTDTLQLARQKHPMAPNSLDALCKRYGIDASRRTKHGALLDSELLAEVYLELIGGRQTALGLAAPRPDQAVRIDAAGAPRLHRTRPVPLPPRIDEIILKRHADFVRALEGATLWPLNDNETEKGSG